MLRPTTRQAVFRALWMSQAAILLLVVPDGNGGGYSDGSRKIDMQALVGRLSVLYLDASVVVFIVGYLIARRVAVRLAPSGVSVGKRLTAWTSVTSLSATDGIRARVLLKSSTGKKALPLPRRRFDGGDDFEIQQQLVEAYHRAYGPYGTGEPVRRPGTTSMPEQTSGWPVVAAAAVVAVVAFSLTFAAFVGTTTDELVSCTTRDPKTGNLAPALVASHVKVRHLLFLPDRYTLRGSSGPLSSTQLQNTVCHGL